MKIVRIRARAFRGLPDGEYDLDENGSRLVVVDGAPGTGKTSFLEAIAVARTLAGGTGALPAPETLLRRGASDGRLEVTWRLTDQETQAADVGDAHVTTAFTLRPDAPYQLVDPGIRHLFAADPLETPPGCGGVVLFDARRWLPPFSGLELSEDAGIATRVGDRGERFSGLLAWAVHRVVDAGIDALDALEQGGVIARWDREDVLADVRGGLRTLAPDLHLARIELRRGRALVWFVRRDVGQLELADLSDGDRMRFLYALAFRRFALASGIALVDDVDLASSPDQRDVLLRGLLDLADDVQLVVTTRQRRVAVGLPPHRVLALGGDR